MLNKVKARFKNVFEKSVVVVENAPQTLDATATLGLAGMADDRTSKILMGATIVASTVSIVAVSPVVSKVALCVAGGCFMSGFVRGFRSSMMKA